MKNVRILVGIISIILFISIFWQSVIVIFEKSFVKNGDIGDSVGFILAFAYLISGIISIRLNKSKNGIIFAICLYIISTLIVFMDVGLKQKLSVGAWLAIVLAIVLIIDLIKKANEKK